MQAQAKTYASWTGSVDSDVDMGDSHYVSWQAMIDRIAEKDLSGARVLDFGCNQGAFLRHLYRQRPFASAVGIDLAEDTIAQATKKITAEPITYKVGGDPSAAGGPFDLAFSHEVLYLLPDLADHAARMAKALKPGGSYYIALGAHGDNPMWPRWHEIISGFSPVKPQTYTADDIAAAFTKNDFDVYAQKMPCTGFLKYNPQSKYYEDFYEKLSYYFENFVLFRMIRR